MAGISVSNLLSGSGFFASNPTTKNLNSIKADFNSMQSASSKPPVSAIIKVNSATEAIASDALIYSNAKSRFMPR